jgi:uncharacterized protein (DUF2235 family)
MQAEHSGFEAPASKGRNLVICCDGTNNEFGEVNTNVVRLAQVIDRNPLKQLLYYDPGVGTMAEPGVYGFLHKWASKINGLAFGGGLDWKVQEAYSFLMDYWQPGDRIFIFGFSRGAYSARVLAAMLHEIGLLPRGAYNLVPYAMNIFKGSRDERAKGKTDQYETLCKNFRWTFSRPVFPHDEQRHLPVHFLGVWDTVSSVGWVWDPERFRYTARNPSVSIIRHAVSIDERRWFFRQNLFKPLEPAPDGTPPPPQDLLEVWFPGVHCDVGGGYGRTLNDQPSELWRVTFDWMLHHARAAGLLIDPIRLDSVLAPIPSDPRPWNDARHESLEGPWFLAEYFPKQVWNSKSQKHELAIGGCGSRTIPSGALIHKSALLRIRDQGLQYDPPNMNAGFVKQVRALGEVPETLPYA